MRVVKCPSGAELKVNVAPFADSKRLYQALLKELQSVKVPSVSKDSDDAQVENLFKDLFCLGFSSTQVEDALKPCLLKCMYNTGRGDLKIEDDSFEAENLRQDYMFVLLEVTKDNVLPFGKALFAEFTRLLPKLVKNQA